MLADEEACVVMGEANMPRPDDRHLCEYCGFRYPTLHGLAVHIRDLHVEGDGMWWYLACGNVKKFKYRQDYNQEKFHCCINGGDGFAVCRLLVPIRHAHQMLLE